MPIVRALGAGLTLLGRHGTLIAALSIFVGLAVPPLAAACKPYLGEAIIVLVTLSFLRVDPAELRGHWTSPGLIVATNVWIMLLLPVVVGLLFLAFHIDRRAPGLYFMFVLQMSAPGLMSSPALAAMMGLDAALTLASLIVGFAIAPVTASLFTHLFLGSVVISPVAFGLRLFLIIAGSALAAAVIRRIAGSAFIEAQRERIDGLNVIAFSTFAIAAMDGVPAHFMAEPLLVVKLTGLAFLLTLGQLAITALLFRRAGDARAFAIGLIAGNRNVGLMLAATGFMVPDVAWLYFALAQFPIYLLPHLLKPLARRLVEKR